MRHAWPRRGRPKRTDNQARRPRHSRPFAIPHRYAIPPSAPPPPTPAPGQRSEEHTSELQSLMRISYAVFCLKKQTTYSLYNHPTTSTHNNNRPTYTNITTTTT